MAISLPRVAARAVATTLVRVHNEWMANDRRRTKVSDLSSLGGSERVTAPLLVRGSRGRGTRAAAMVSREVESKFEIGEGFTMPEFDGLPGVAGVAEPQIHSLDAIYFDTDDLRLLAHGVTLRRRTGGSDAGWHLKLPEAAVAATRERQEVRLPIGRTRTVPAALARQVAVYARGEALVPVVRLRTRRVERPVLASDGRVLAEIAEDEVSASAPSANGAQTSVSAWSELEVELVEGPGEVLAAISERVVRAGALPSASPSKVSRALSDRLDLLGRGPGSGSVANGRPILPERSAGAVVLAHLAEHVRRLQANDPLVRADEHDAVHQMRVATRRLRSALATFRPLFDRDVTDPLREELQWLAGVLGAARDAEVIRDRLRHLVDAEPGDLVLGPVQARIITTMGTRYRRAHATVLSELDGRRYFDLLEALDRLVDQPAVTEVAAGKADKVLLPLVAKSWKKMKRLHRAAQQLQRSAEDADRAEHLDHPHGLPPGSLVDVTGQSAADLALHELRKAAKRARYAGEAVTARYGKDARRWAGAMEAIQETLGGHQDTVVVRAQLRELAVAAHLDGESAFTYGRLHALEQARAGSTVRDYRPDWKRATQPALHRWLRT